MTETTGCTRRLHVATDEGRTVPVAPASGVDPVMTEPERTGGSWGRAVRQDGSWGPDERAGWGTVPDRIAFLQHSASDVPGLLGEFAADLGLAVAVHHPAALPVPGSFDLLVVLGSIESVTDTGVPWIAPERAMVAGAVEAGVPVLGVCFGAQLLADVLGGSVARGDRTEIGWTRIRTADPDVVATGPWLNWHDDVITCPPGAEVMATSDLALQAFVAGRHTGVQFHPEVTVDVVLGWVDDARDGDGVADADVTALLSGFDAGGRGAEAGARALFRGFLDRARRPVRRPA